MIPTPSAENNRNNVESQPNLDEEPRAILTIIHLDEEDFAIQERNNNHFEILEALIGSSFEPNSSDNQGRYFNYSSEYGEGREDLVLHGVPNDFIVPESEFNIVEYERNVVED